MLHFVKKSDSKFESSLYIPTEAVLPRELVKIPTLIVNFTKTLGSAHSNFIVRIIKILKISIFYKFS